MMFRCCVYLLCVLPIVNCSPDVQLHPEDPMAALSSWVNFTCSGTGNNISWRVNNELIVGSELKSRNVTVYHHSAPAGNVSSTLVILASHNNDAISITCVATDNYGFIDFEITILRVEGITPVRNLMVKDSDDVMLITWDEPVFQSQSAKTIYYTVTVTESDSLVFSVKDIVDHQYSVSLSLFSLCSVYSIGVVAYAGLFASDTNSVIQQDSVDVNISVVNHFVTYEKKMFSIEHFVSVNGPCNYTVIGITRVDNEVKDEKILQTDSNSEMYTYTATNLTTGITGNMSFRVNDTLHTVKAAVDIPFNTTHVTGVNAFIGNDGSICVECSFINGSDADGCEIELRDHITNDCVSCRYTISKVYSSSVSSKCFAHPFQGNFSVFAYDKVDGEKSPLWAAVYTELPEYMLVPAEDILLSTVSLVLRTSRTSVITSDSNFTPDVSSYIPTETEIPVPRDVNLLTLIPAFVSLMVVCVCAILVAVVVCYVYRKLVANYRIKERKGVEQASPITDQNTYEMQLCEYGRRTSIESDLQHISEFVPEQSTSVQASPPDQKSCEEKPPEIPGKNRDNPSTSVEVVAQCEGQADQKDNARSVYMKSVNIQETGNGPIVGVNGVIYDQENAEYPQSVGSMEFMWSTESEEPVNSSFSSAKKKIHHHKDFLETTAHVRMAKLPFSPEIRQISSVVELMIEENVRESASSYSLDEFDSAHSEMVVPVMCSPSDDAVVVVACTCSKVVCHPVFEERTSWIENEDIEIQRLEDIRQGRENEGESVHGTTEDLPFNEWMKVGDVFLHANEEEKCKIQAEINLVEESLPSENMKIQGKSNVSDVNLNESMKSEREETAINLKTFLLISSIPSVQRISLMLTFSFSVSLFLSSLFLVNKNASRISSISSRIEHQSIHKAISEQGLLLSDRDKDGGTALDLLKNSYDNDVQKRKEQCLQGSKGSMAKVYQQVEEVN